LAWECSKWVWFLSRVVGKHSTASYCGTHSQKTTPASLPCDCRGRACNNPQQHILVHVRGSRREFRAVSESWQPPYPLLQCHVSPPPRPCWWADSCRNQRQIVPYIHNAATHDVVCLRGLAVAFWTDTLCQAVRIAVALVQHTHQLPLVLLDPRTARIPPRWALCRLSVKLQWPFQDSARMVKTEYKALACHCWQVSDPKLRHWSCPLAITQTLGVWTADPRGGICIRSCRNRHIMLNSMCLYIWHEPDKLNLIMPDNVCMLARVEHMPPPCETAR